MGAGFGPLKGRVSLRVLGLPVGTQRPLISEQFDLESRPIVEWRDSDVILRFTPQDRAKIRQAVRQVRAKKQSFQLSPGLGFQINTRQCTWSPWS